MQGKYPSITTIFWLKNFTEIYFDSRIKSHHQADKLLKKCYHV